MVSGQEFGVCRYHQHLSSSRLGQLPDLLEGDLKNTRSYRQDEEQACEGSKKREKPSCPRRPPPSREIETVSLGLSKSDALSQLLDLVLNYPRGINEKTTVFP